MIVKSTLGTLRIYTLIQWLFLISLTYCQQKINIFRTNYRTENNFDLKLAAFDFTSPIFLGTVGAGILVIIIIIILYCVCRKKPEALAEEKKEPLPEKKQEMFEKEESPKEVSVDNVEKVDNADRLSQTKGK